MNVLTEDRFQKMLTKGHIIRVLIEFKNARWEVSTEIYFDNVGYKYKIQIPEKENTASLDLEFVDITANSAIIEILEGWHENTPKFLNSVSQFVYYKHSSEEVEFSNAVVISLLSKISIVALYQITRGNTPRNTPLVKLRDILENIITKSV